MRPLILGSFAILSLGIGVAACGDSDSGGGGVGGVITPADAGTDATEQGATDSGSDVTDAGSDALTGYPASFEAPPQVANLKGPVLANPKLVPVFFAGDDATFQGQLADFISKVGATPYFATAVREYGVHAATALPPVLLTESAPATIDDAAIQTWLQGKLNGNDPLWPAADVNTVYVLHYPAGTTITLSGSTSCTGFGGYHSDTQLDTSHGSAFVAYAVVPRCTSFGTLSGIDAVSGAESHEIMEAVTDPYPMDDPGYAEVDEQHIYWERVLGGGEVGDMCAQFPGAFTKFSGLDYTVQRIWSNKQAKAGHDPCQPTSSGAIYFNATPVLTDNVVLSISGQQVSVKGVKIPVGQSKTIDVELFSDAPTSGPWTVSAENASSTQYLAFSFDKTTGVNGDKLHLTITASAGSKRGTETFLLKSTLAGQENFWIGIVGTPVVNDGGVEGGTDGGDGGDASDDGGATDASDGG